MRKILLASLNWCRPKDPPVALSTASLESVLSSQKIDYDSKSWNVNSEDFSWRDVVAFAMDNADKDADFAIGAYVWNELFTQQIIRKLKWYGFPGRIIIGGPQVSYAKRNLEHYYPHGDVFIRGYGENALSKYAVGEKNIKGLHYAGKPDLSLSANVDLESLPSPFLEGFVPPQRFIRWETQRGCPFRCSFCQHRESDVSMKRKLFAEERITKEVEWICDHPVVQDIAVLDPTFNSGSIYLDVLNKLADMKYDGKIAFQCRLEMVNAHFIQAVSRLNQSARVVLEFGVQTIHKKEQKLIQRFNNLKKSESVMKELNEHGIESEMSLIFGLPEQTVESFKCSISWCQKVKPTRIIAFPLMLLRGTPLYDAKEHLGLMEDTRIAHPAIDRIQDGIPHVIASPSFTFDDWKSMADIAVSINQQ